MWHWRIYLFISSPSNSALIVRAGSFLVQSVGPYAFPDLNVCVKAPCFLLSR
ncbi:hypothetical protein CZ787_15160 [Halomonas citrativorans]|uniref:Uncharacterized protein n=1 Tax=Halomonas citrativorans TaxID=2742612 RepID=A0A1R4I3I2_9GAMM|nr:hypothetical protein CZ787_15160 [Halomonas citrativorans]